MKLSPVLKAVTHVEYKQGQLLSGELIFLSTPRVPKVPWGWRWGGGVWGCWHSAVSRTGTCLGLNSGISEHVHARLHSAPPTCQTYQSSNIRRVNLENRVSEAWCRHACMCVCVLVCVCMCVGVCVYVCACVCMWEIGWEWIECSVEDILIKILIEIESSSGWLQKMVDLFKRTWLLTTCGPSSLCDRHATTMRPPWEHRWWEFELEWHIRCTSGF